MIDRILVTLCLSVFGIIVPILEVNQTHVFNPDWPAHARLHEVWQLITNCAFAALGLWLAWFRGNLRFASGIGLIVVVGFLAAYLLRFTYSGSMRHPDGTELAVMGVNSAVLVMVIAGIILTVVFVKNARAKD
jgi:hypothetical protein